jgi:transposase InsO family protein
MPDSQKKKLAIDMRLELFEAFYNGHAPIEDLARKASKSVRTIYRYLRSVKEEQSQVTPPPPRPRTGRPKFYGPKVFARALELKTEMPRRSAIIIRKTLLREFPSLVPAMSTIRAYLHAQGFAWENPNPNKGYVTFERAAPNDLWQIDIAGVQYYGHLGECYLVALMDDCSRHVVAAQYYPDQQLKWVIAVVRMAVEKYGRPNQVLADNGAQFRGMLRGQESRYEELLKALGIQPIFARPRHPQTKGKVERWFGTVLQQFYPEELARVNGNPRESLAELNRSFGEWVAWYNTQKPHRSLPGNVPPFKIFSEKPGRIYRPLEAPVNWARYLSEATQRKVRKTNLVQYKQRAYPVPEGYSGKILDLFEFTGHLQIFHRDTFIIEHPVTHAVETAQILQEIKRVVAKSGMIRYNGVPLYVGYKLAGKTACLRVKEEEGRILAYIDNLLVKSFDVGKA